ncbi:MAG: 3',5'-cyclic-nucleotide phosphodiesterase [Gammaproteobacteria bacterium]|nr:3',5'-cyclic-nucleotide phosphodiesterase [Gammaproteobacteria bacterium]MBU1506029.1 3',5'-cyclic-nucleotide phosphodiesterase [Gammaproteobacteria bacterium]MBU2123578.1 3',5'-cyclic-nucleotide phosphodiesterase [Gammaproteobacteria bacterium]MBU2169512.1 3',5'-cyclic-nucleotide phosphodiesterase [Gammaproteobacteria bacterium]MBU2202198.1 3',5'-cyclic-nucleotide phosphodiesterase [Gammaproteobacteria bacterium]
MKVRVLGCSGAIAKDCRTTSFLIGDSILIDAGTGVGDLTLEEMSKVDHVFLTHSHLDHIAALPLMLDAVSSLRNTPVQVYALLGTIAALQTHVFNDVIWPDFSAIPSTAEPFMQYHAIQTGQQIDAGGILIEALPALHTVPAVGYAVRGADGWLAFSGDTGRNPAFWARVNTLPIALLIIETAFSNREVELANRSLHLSPFTLAEELANILPGQRYPIYITHTKPSETELIMKEIRQFEAHMPEGFTAPLDIRWLKAGQEFVM